MVSHIAQANGEQPIINKDRGEDKNKPYTPGKIASGPYYIVSSLPAQEMVFHDVLGIVGHSV
jgi:hypothetical protein